MFAREILGRPKRDLYISNNYVTSQGSESMVHSHVTVIIMHARCTRHEAQTNMLDMLCKLKSFIYMIKDISSSSLKQQLK